MVALANDHNITLTSKPIDDAIVAAPEDFETADVPDEARVIVLVPNGKDWPRQRSSIAIERCEVEVYDAGPGQAIGSMIGMALTSRDYPDLCGSGRPGGTPEQCLMTLRRRRRSEWQSAR